MFFFTLFQSSISLIKRSKKQYIYPKSNNYDLVSLDQMIRLGWKDITWDSVDELNRCLYTFDITTPERIRHFMIQCSIKSKFGKQKTDETPPSYDDNYYWYPYGKNPYRGSGYLLLATQQNYQKFEMFMGDTQITKKGADYVAQNYPWASAGFIWMMKDLNLYCSFPFSLQIVAERLNDPYSDSTGNFIYFLVQDLAKLYQLATTIW